MVSTPSFRFDSPAAGVAVTGAAAIARANQLQEMGDASSSSELLQFLQNASEPRLRQAAACAIQWIAHRAMRDESSRPLKGLIITLQNLARVDPDALVRSASSEAAASITRATTALAAWPAPPPQRPAARSAAALAATSSPSPPAAPSATKDSLYDALVELRKRLAAAEGKEKQPFVVASNEVLAAVAAARPRSEQALLKIRGIGKHKLDAYGSAILECISEHAPLSPTSQAAAGAAGEKGAFAGWKRKRGPTSVDAEDAAIADGRADDESGAAQLSAEQTRALDAVRAGHSIFLTGSAGTGKSFTLRKVIEVLRRMHGKDHVFVTASTGIAASNVGGTTVHSYAGIGLGHAPADELADKVLAKQAVRKRWLLTRALIIDEISMLDGGLFDKLDHVARRVRAARPIMLPSTSSASSSADAPFGGIQLVLCGDFFQLPPVGMERDPTAAGKAVRFMFESHAWRSLGLTSCCLTRSFRQKDPGFIALLDEMRRGSLSPFSAAAPPT